MITRHIAKKTACIGLLIVAASAQQLNATSLQMTAGTLYSSFYDNGGMGTGRGIGFVANTSFHINTLGIDISRPSSVADTEYRFDVYSSTDGGHTAGAFLGGTAFHLALGNGWQDFSLPFNFSAGNSYVINFSRTDNQYFGQLGTHYSWEPSALVNYGILTMTEGFEAEPPSNYNPLVPHMRIDYGATSAPDTGLTIGMFGFAVACLSAMRARFGRA